MILILAVCFVAGVVALLVAIGAKRGLLGRSVLLAAGAGLLYGLEDAATRASTLIARHDGLQRAHPHRLEPGRRLRRRRRDPALGHGVQRGPPGLLAAADHRGRPDRRHRAGREPAR